MHVALPLGEVVDKVTILLLKEKYLSSPEALHNVQAELAALKKSWADAGLSPMETLAGWHRLCEVNAALWKVEDDLRDCERAQQFDTHFISLARSVYHLNDQRAILKRSINTALGSELIEEKSYSDYSVSS